MSTLLTQGYQFDVKERGHEVSQNLKALNLTSSLSCNAFFPAEQCQRNERPKKRREGTLVVVRRSRGSCCTSIDSRALSFCSCCSRLRNETWLESTSDTRVNPQSVSTRRQNKNSKRGNSIIISKMPSSAPSIAAPVLTPSLVSSSQSSSSPSSSSGHHEKESQQQGQSREQQALLEQQLCSSSGSSIPDDRLAAVVAAAEVAASMYDAYQAWALKTYGDSAKTKTVTRKKYNRIMKILRGEECSSVENSKFRFWVKAKGFKIAADLSEDSEGEQVLYVPATKPGASSSPSSQITDFSAYKRVAVVENFYDIIYNVHVEMDGRSGKHAGQKRTYRAVRIKESFLFCHHRSFVSHTKQVSLFLSRHPFMFTVLFCVAKRVQRLHQDLLLQGLLS